MSSIPVPDEQTYYSSRRQDDVDAPELSAVHGTSRLSALTWRDHVLERDVRLDAAGL